MRVNGVVTHLLLFGSAFVVSMVILSLRADTPPASVSKLPVALSPAPPADRLASHHAPAALPAAPEAAVRASEADDAVAAGQGSAAVRTEPLAPDAELARLRALLDDSGTAAGDALDRSSRDIADALVAQLRTGSTDVSATAVECRAAGCRVTLTVAPGADDVRLHQLLEGTAFRSPLQRWPGSRILRFATQDSGQRVIHILLVRPDSTVNFGG